MDSLERSLSSLSVSGRCSPSDPTYLLDLSLSPPPGRSVSVACSDFTVRLHDERDLKLSRTFVAHGGPISNVRFAHRSENRVYSASLDGTVRLWDVRSAGGGSAQVFESDAGFHRFSSFDLSCDDRLLCAGTEQVNGEDSFLVFWDARKPGQALLGVYSESHSDDITQVRFHPTDKDRLASGSTDGLVNVFDVSKGSEEDALLATCNSESSVSALCWLAGERLLCASHDEGLRLWDLKSLDTEDELTVYSTRDARTRQGHSSADPTVDYLIGGCWFESQVLVFGGSSEGDVHLFTCDRSGLNLVRTLRGGHTATVCCLGFDSHTLFTGGEDGRLLRWSPEDDRGTVSEQDVGSSRQQRSSEDEPLRRKQSMKSESVMRQKSRPHRKHKLKKSI